MVLLGFAITFALHRIMKTISLNSKFTFDDVVTGPSDRQALKIALSVIQSLGKVCKPVYLYGEIGNGCTHLMQADCGCW